ncbi:hypothetical protein GGX14DRAFT_591678 [Mycena pura]|uniref:Autophagy-related protein 2 n=1 Tax=Mycena pura TaxID=153505 RepID=A0AAD6YIE0_9AGAR|nr:hypothetical protein GGX14DRAFT_591678 [Mycena pura]
MSSWYSAWLPALPSIGFSLPASIQRRFISFALKRSLGHLLKPGQLDIDQIDSQIGSGYVQINDLQLNNETINSALSGLPVELHEGSIARVTARIPWPNPLTSTVGISVHSLHLTFHVSPSQNHAPPATQNLAESVASVANSFIHDELSPREEATLRESFHPDLASSMHSEDDHNIPGGLDPFISAPEEDDFHADADPPGISIFATLIESLLARFEFHAVDTNITLVHPDHTSFSICIPDIAYCTEQGPDEDGSPQDLKSTRTVTVSGVSVSASNLRRLIHISSSPSAMVSKPSYMASAVPPQLLQRRVSPEPRSRSASPASSSSSLDEEALFAMSQSLAFLPQRPGSPASSVASSMYQSAISHAPYSPDGEELQEASGRSTPSLGIHVEDTFVPPSNPDFQEHTPKAEVILAFGLEPLVIRLTPMTQRPEPPHGVQASSIPVEVINLSVEVEIIGCALRAWHIKGIMDLLDVVTKALEPKKSTSNPTPATVPSSLAIARGPMLHLQMSLRGVVILMIPAALPGTEPHSMSDFFSRPLIPRQLSQSYLRIHLGSISATIAPVQPGSDANALAFSLGELSAFVFHPSATQEDPVLCASPLLITDHNLHTQYSPWHLHPNLTDQHAHTPLPSFALIDWTDPKHKSVGMKVSYWRTKVKPQPGKSRRDSQMEAESPASDVAASQTPQSSPAIALTMKRSILKHKQTTTAVEVVIEPLHLFLDFDLVSNRTGLLPFLDELTEQHSTESEHADNELASEGSDEDTPPTTPRSRKTQNTKEQERERRRLERMVLEDLDLDLDYRPDASSQKPPTEASKRKPRGISVQPITRITIKSQMIRVQIRCPSPVGQPVRSGALVLDIHDVHVSTGPVEKNTTRFASHDVIPSLKTPETDMLCSVGCRRIVVACSFVGESRASALLSVGPLVSGTAEHSEFPLLPFVTLSKSLPSRVSHPVPGPSTVTVVVQIPSAYVHLSKPQFDALQYLADDCTQLIERSFGSDSGSDTEQVESRDTSLIGSRFFAKSRSGSGSGSGISASRNSSKSRAVIKLEITEGKSLDIFATFTTERSLASVRIMLPSVITSSRPFDIIASDLDVLVESKPEGKDETVVTLVVMGLNVKNTTPAGASESLLSLTTPRGLTSPSNPILKLAFTSLVVPETTAKESRLRATLWGFTFNLSPNIQWAVDLGSFIRSPPGAFESVIPTEKTSISLKVNDGSIRVLADNHPGAVVIHTGSMDFSTNVVGDSPDSSFHITVSELAVLMIDDLGDTIEPSVHNYSGVRTWTRSGFALLSEISDLELIFKNTISSTPPDTLVLVERVQLRLHLCADSLSSVAEFAKDLTSAFKPADDDEMRATCSIRKHQSTPAVVSPTASSEGLMASVDEMAFNRMPEVGPPPDMVNDDLPTNMDYLDESFGAAAGLREFRDEDLDDFDVDDNNMDKSSPTPGAPAIVSKVGGETVKMLRPEGLRLVEHYFDTLPPDTTDASSTWGVTTTRLRVHKGDIYLFLYDGYDWAKTRKTIEGEVKEMRRRLAKIRQLVAGGQSQDPTFEETGTLLFNSVYIGLEQDVDELEPAALIAAIDEELRDDFDTTSQSSWQSLRPSAGSQPRTRSLKVHGKRLTRAKSPSIEFQLLGVESEVDQYHPDEPIVSRTFVTVKDLEILDHIKTSTWRKFLTELRSDSHGNVRETDSNMVRVDLRSVRPVLGHPSEEARLRAKILPLRLYVDQDALDFLKKFFSFKDAQSESGTPANSDSTGDTYFQLAEIFPVDLKLDYKPRRVDYRALREGRTIELMNFFHFDGAEMTLRHITLAGVTGWPRLFDMLNDIWTPDVKATQLVDVISGVAPIRSVVNVGSGVADLVLLPIAQYKKDGRIVRGVQKGATAFFKSTAVEAIKLGARLATGTQVILEQAEDVLGGQFKSPVTTETVQPVPVGNYGHSASDEDDEPEDLISRYAEQPADLKEGVQSAYKSLQRNFNSAAQTILAVPMEVYERSGSEGPVRSVIRAVPIAVLKPMIGASEAVSKTLLGLHNTLDPNVRHENEAKYKHR